MENKFITVHSKTANYVVPVANIALIVDNTTERRITIKGMNGYEILVVSDSVEEILGSIKGFKMCSTIAISALEDKQLVWAWDKDYISKRILGFYDKIHETLFTNDGSRDGCIHDYYTPYIGTYPDWALNALDKLDY